MTRRTKSTITTLTSGDVAHETSGAQDDALIYPATSTSATPTDKQFPEITTSTVVESGETDVPSTLTENS